MIKIAVIKEISICDFMVDLMSKMRRARFSSDPG